MSKVHGHKSYSRTFCGKDAAHIPMTHDPTRVTCKNCIKAATKPKGG